MIDLISNEIASGRLTPEARLPTEQEMMVAMGVSRTAVREAACTLKADELVITRQGSGAFVAHDRACVPFRIDPDGLSSIADVINRAIRRNEAAISEDFGFHPAIAEATSNPHDAEFLLFLGRHVIPRQSVRATVTTDDEQTAYLKKIQSEHRQIAPTIRACDKAAARRAMRMHLGNSHARYRRLAKLAAG